MKTFLAFLLSIAPVLGQLAYAPSMLGTWDPRNLSTKAGIVASYDPGNTGANVSNPVGWAAGSGVSALSNRVTTGTADLLQGTAANQSLLSRADNKGNLALQSEAFNTTWTLTKCNAFGATDTGVLGAGSFANTARTTDPLGGNTADFIQEDATAATIHYIKQETGAHYTADYTLSVYAKPSGRTWVRFGEGNNANRMVYFDIANGVTGTVGGLVLASSITASVNGWYLLSVTVNVGAIQFLITGASGDNGWSYDGDNTSGLFLWGASLRPSTWDSTYIPTTTVPIYAGLGGRQVAYFDGSAYRMATAAFTLNQPTSIYGLFEHLTWTLNDAVFDGNGLSSGKFYESATTPKLRGNAGTDMTEFVPPSLGTWQVDNVVFDGASSRISTNSGAFVVSDANTSNMGGFTLGSAATAGTTYWNGLCGRVLICNKTNSAAEDGYLRWGLLKQASLY